MSLCFLGMKINFKLRVDVFKGLQDNVLETLRCGFLLETTEPKASVLWRLSESLLGQEVFTVHF